MNAIVVMTTVGSLEVGEKLASALVEEKLAACVQILPAIESIYRWKGDVQKETEHLLLIKTTADRWEALSAFIETNHPYEVPELIALDAVNIAPKYREWLAAQIEP